MRASEFLKTLATVGPGQEREQAILDAATSGSWVRWPQTLVVAKGGGREVGFVVTDDYFAIGELEDYIRVPMSPLTAQAIGDRLGFMLPTPRMVDLAWIAAPNKAEPITIGDLGLGLSAGTKAQMAISTYAAHNAAIDAQLRPKLGPGLVAGHKKDVVISNRLNSGMVQIKECPDCEAKLVDSSKQVCIYGWQRKAAFATESKLPALPGMHVIQGVSIVHDANYADYSHGVRMVSPLATVDGQPAKLTDVLADPVLSKLLSHEGPLTVLRQPHVRPPVGSGWQGGSFLPSSNCARDAGGCMSGTAAASSLVDLDALFAAPLPPAPSAAGAANWPPLVAVAAGVAAGFYGLPALQRWWRSRA